jgi:DNA-directed RNA polymerase specialized sigma24 family protein
MNKKNKERFEKSFHLINSEINKRKNKWTLSALNWIDFEDVSQIIRFHIFKKWELYDPKKPMLPWVNRIISNQIKNLIRNNYGNYARPCLKCAAAIGESGCRIYTNQNDSCPMYKSWCKTKKNAYDLKMAVSIEDHSFEINNQPCNSSDTQRASENLHAKMKEILKPIEWKVYELLYISNKSEEQVCKLLNFKYDKNAKTAYNKQLRNIQKSIIKKAKQCLANGEIDL